MSRLSALKVSMTTVPRSILWTLAVLILLTVLGLIRTFVFSGREDGAINPPPLVSITVVKAVELADVVTFSGTIAARDEAAISAEGEGGRVSALNAEVGDRVNAGQVLARLDTSLVAPQVASLEASLQESKANAAVAEADYRRAQAVASTGALSAQEIERRGAAAIAAGAKVKVVSAQLAEAQARLRRTDVRAPFDGIVLTRSAEVGQLAGPGGAPLFRIGRAGGIEMRGNVAERDLPSLAPRQPARVRVTGVEQAFEGQVRLIGAVIDPQTRLGSVRIDLPANRDLRPGAFARGEISVGSGRRPLLPQTAVMSDTMGNYVFVVDASNKVERRDVRVEGSRVEGVVIGSGLRGGEKVVTTAGPYLRAGEAVRVMQ
ncbi:MAG: efflux RND transporter periplasmic adaptor subunit [Gammaproteobacteria bacterium]|nr:efflux RND transporter periplasmic adaptor subunit [Gammaproteobacteria bacterium]